MGRPESDVNERFWSKVQIRGDNECWLWLAGVDKNGYGIFRYRNFNYRAHRFALFGMNAKTIAELACHSCDFSSCVNPKHLFAGSPKDNTQDMITKNRRYRTTGMGHPMAKLTEQDVLRIRSIYMRNVYGYKRIAKEYPQVTTRCIERIIKRTLWREI